METKSLINAALDDSAWLRDTYAVEGDSPNPTDYANQIRRKLRSIAARHYLMIEEIIHLQRQLYEKQNGT